MIYGWAGTGVELLQNDPRRIVQQLAESQLRNYQTSPSAEQLRAWSTQVHVLVQAFRAIDAADRWGVVFEYELPFEGGRRPDKVVLAAERVAPLEFKQASRPTRADIDQVAAYGRDLGEYHSECHGREVCPALVLPNVPGLDARDGSVRVVSGEKLPLALRELRSDGPQLDLQRWLSGTYAPLPTLVEAARRVFHDEPLPYIKRAESAGVPRLLAWLHQLVRDAAQRGEKHVVFITGVPGSGKTLAGLQFVHECEVEGGDGQDAVFLSGNDPLVAVLQDALKSRTFVRPVRQFVLEYAVRRRAAPPWPVIVFDEAQRAWDAERGREKRGHAHSEPEILLDLLAARPKWGALVALVGEGQEIHVGEEAGFAQWRDALDRHEGVRVHTAPRLESVFAGARTEPLLDLTLSLRTHRAERAHLWVNAVLEGRLREAATLASELRREGYDLYVTRDLLVAKDYVLTRYENAPTKRIGLLASSKGKNLVELGVDNSYFGTQRIDLGRWYNAARDDPRSGCQLLEPVTEFQSQGLELDMGILCWGDDFGWDAGWRSYRRTRAARDSHRLRTNSYRVLLTRSRDGTVVFVPANLGDRGDGLAEMLGSAGARMLA